MPEPSKEAMDLAREVPLRGSWDGESPCQCIPHVDGWADSLCPTHEAIAAALDAFAKDHCRNDMGKLLLATERERNDALKRAREAEGVSNELNTLRIAAEERARTLESALRNIACGLPDYERSIGGKMVDVARAALAKAAPPADDAGTQTISLSEARRRALESLDVAERERNAAAEDVYEAFDRPNWPATGTQKEAK